MCTIFDLCSNVKVDVITEAEFDRICDGICADADTIVRFNPIGTRAEILLWMMLSSLVIYLSIPDNEAPCFPGRPDENSYREAIKFVLANRRSSNFDIDAKLERISEG